MARSLYKLPYVHRSLWEKFINLRKNRIFTEKMAVLVVPEGTPLSNNLYFWKRSSLLNERLAKTGKTIGIYNGFAFLILYLKKDFSGYKVGQFSVTRRTPRHKGKQRQKKKV